MNLKNYSSNDLENIKNIKIIIKKKLITLKVMVSLIAVIVGIYFVKRAK